ncbi:DUF502 domain-containing protein [Calycomorphotria hydatis]|nr:DUF502 domain-containing protein [Calycomorphotria hydatis]
MADDSTHSPEPLLTAASRSPGRIFLRGLAISLPSILTLVILLWLGGLVYRNIIHPISWTVQYSMAKATSAARPAEGLVDWKHLPELKFTRAPYDATYRITSDRLTRLEARRRAMQNADQLVPASWLEEDPEGVYVVYGNQAVPYAHYRDVAEHTPAREMPTNALDLYAARVTIEFFGSSFILSLLAVTITLAGIYFAGRVVTVRLGAYLVNRFEENVLGKLPLVSKVYTSVKQVTDFLFSERTVEYNRVVAIEYPRNGIWSLGFVTGASMQQLAVAASEPMVSVLIPTSPMPMTGYTMSLPRSHVLDLDITVDQAFQFTISCGVLVPPNQVVTAASLEKQIRERLNGHGPERSAVPKGGAPLTDLQPPDNPDEDTADYD